MCLVGIQPCVSIISQSCHLKAYGTVTRGYKHSFISNFEKFQRKNLSQPGIAIHLNEHQTTTQPWLTTTALLNFMAAAKSSAKPTCGPWPSSSTQSPNSSS
jgi:hypothetical protein